MIFNIFSCEILEVQQTINVGTKNALFKYIPNIKSLGSCEQLLVVNIMPSVTLYSISGEIDLVTLRHYLCSVSVADEKMSFDFVQ